MFITRKVEFSASHVCRTPGVSDEENLRLFGPAANPHGHGHNYVLEVTLAGEPDAVTGMVLDLKELKEILNREVIDIYDHRFLNYEVPPFDRLTPTVENMACDIWRRLAPQAGRRQSPAALRPPLRDLRPVRRLLWRRAVFRLTRRYHFSASHRLHAPELGEDENRLLYGKCNNPYGHGHNYMLEVSARGPLDVHGRAVDTFRLDELVARHVLAAFDHRNLNLEAEVFQHQVPTSENLAREICRRLKRHWGAAFPGPWPQLEMIRIAETPRNIFEIRTDEIQ